MIVGLIDYGMGNLLSARNALVSVGADVRVLSSGRDADGVTAYVLPGVGSFGKGMEGLRERGFVELLERDVRLNGKPILGICLGLQLFADRGTELGEHRGLGWLPGEVTRLVVAPEYRVPHIGWNDVSGTGPLFDGIPKGSSFYFVHSFHFVPDQRECISGQTEHGMEFVSAIRSGNIYGVQFHPEKSHKHGLRLLRNFIQIAAEPPAC